MSGDLLIVGPAGVAVAVAGGTGVLVEVRVGVLVGEWIIQHGARAGSERDYAGCGRATDELERPDAGETEQAEVQRRSDKHGQRRLGRIIALPVEERVCDVAPVPIEGARAYDGETRIREDGCVAPRTEVVRAVTSIRACHGGLLEHVKRHRVQLSDDSEARGDMIGSCRHVHLAGPVRRRHRAWCERHNNHAVARDAVIVAVFVKE
jgi:hypothetical protein